MDSEGGGVDWYCLCFCLNINTVVKAPPAVLFMRFKYYLILPCVRKLAGLYANSYTMMRNEVQ